MPRFDTTGMDTKPIGGSNYQFSATRVEHLGATEYTLATIIIDRSGSVQSYRDAIEQALKAAVEALRMSPRADNLLLRVVIFDHEVVEVHGFRMLSGINPDDYTGVVVIRGSTALYDAAYTGIQATIQEAKTLAANDFDVNGIVFVITDGQEFPGNASKATRKMIKESITGAVTSEAMESLRPVLIGVGATDDKNLGQWLQAFKEEAGFDQFVPLSKADAKALAKIGDFISRSVSSQSQALGTGGASQSLSFG